ncbi:2-hydroxyacyl-CoA dehydratase subunit D [Chloroflexota bacterium]
MAVEYKLNRLDTSGISPLVDEHWRELREAKKEGKKVCWTAGPLWAFRLAYPNVVAHFMAGYASYCGGRGMGDEVLEAAERFGELRDTCSYHRLHTGMAAIIMRNWSITDPRVILPIPDLVYAARACTEMCHYGEALFRRFGIKSITIEWPAPRTKEDIPRIAKFVTGQVKENLIPALEKLSGHKFDEDKMREVYRVWKETCIVRNKCWEYLKRKPALMTLWDYGVSMAPIAYAMGNPLGLEYYKNLLKQLEERAEKNIPALMPEGEKYRLYWDGWLPWGFLGRIMRMFVPNGAIPICGRYPWEFCAHPEDINPEADDVIYEWIRLRTTEPNLGIWHNSPWGAAESIGELAEEYSIDGLLFFSSKTCRMWNLGQQEVIETLDKKYGIPGVVIEGDNIDPSMFSDEQVRTRIEALLETIDARRKGGKRS